MVGVVPLTFAESAVVLNIEPSPGHPRNSEGSFATLASGRIVLPLAFQRSRGTDPHLAKSWDARAIAMWLYSDDGALNRLRIRRVSIDSLRQY
jgi:hypothetical protein